MSEVLFFYLARIGEPAIKRDKKKIKPWGPGNQSVHFS